MSTNHSFVNLKYPSKLILTSFAILEMVYVPRGNPITETKYSRVDQGKIVEDSL